jgi:hypothetical protein
VGPVGRSRFRAKLLGEAARRLGRSISRRIDDVKLIIFHPENGVLVKYMRYPDGGSL